jgi:glycosyltransferase involved in cell wall biosynthesis
MKYIDDAVLYVIGSGDVWHTLQKLVIENGLNSKVILISKLPKTDLMNYTRLADIGISIDKDTNLNYRYSLPNKVFDYIQAEVPILASRLVEIEKVINEFQIGDFIDSHEPNHIADKLQEMVRSVKYLKWKENLKHAKNVLTWEEERKVLLNLVSSIAK